MAVEDGESEEIDAIDQRRLRAYDCEVGADLPGEVQICFRCSRWSGQAGGDGGAAGVAWCGVYC